MTLGLGVGGGLHAPKSVCKTGAKNPHLKLLCPEILQTVIPFANIPFRSENSFIPTRLKWWRYTVVE